MSCTGVAASWCPDCGDCTCVHEDDEFDGRPAAELAVERMGWLNVVETIAGVRFPCRLWCVVESKLLWRGITMDFNGALCRWIDPGCPLHGNDSRHAERPDLFDVVEKAAAELRADGVQLSLDEFLRSRAELEEL